MIKFQRTSRGCRKVKEKMGKNLPSKETKKKTKKISIIVVVLP